MLRSNQLVIAKWMRWVAQIIGLGFAGFLVSILVGGVLTEGLRQDNTAAIQGISLGLLGLIALSGSILSWWRERLAAILLILAAIGLGIHIGVCARFNHLLVCSVLGLPYLIAGILLLESRRLLKQVQ